MHYINVCQTFAHFDLNIFNFLIVLFQVRRLNSKGVDERKFCIMKRWYVYFYL